MKYYKISEKDLIKLLRDSMTLKEILSVRPVSEDLAETELSKYVEIPADAEVSCKFKYVEVEPGRWKRVDKVPTECFPVLGNEPKTKWYSEPLGFSSEAKDSE